MLVFLFILVTEPKFISQALPLERLVPLQETEDSIIAQIDEAILVGDRIWVLSGGQLYQFDLDGTFIQKIARQGQAPHEYLQPGPLVKAFGGMVALSDPVAGKINLYRQDGTFFATTPVVMKFELNYSRFDWSEANRITILNRDGLKSTEAEHAFFHLTEKEGIPKGLTRVQSFSEPFQPYVDYCLIQGKNPDPLIREGLLKVDGNWWIGDPYSASIYVYNEAGEVVNHIEAPKKIAFSRARFAELLKEEKTELELRKFIAFGAYCNRILDLGPHILAIYNLRGAVFYERNGSSLHENPLRMDLPISIWDTEGSRVLTKFLRPKPHMAPAQQLFAAELAEWERLGIPVDYENPVLRIGVFKPWPEIAEKTN